VAEGRVLDAVAARDLRGSIEQIADALGISASHLRAAVSSLGEIGWVEATYHGDDQIWLCLGDDLR
jgi:DNA-binding IclR family transcriptional regulator